jgi:hypothetical protein
LLKQYRRGPIDLEFYARIAVKGIGYRPEKEKIVAIPVDKQWRPALGRSTLVKFHPEQCDERDLRYFPGHILAKRRQGTLTIADLLGVGDAKLRVYVFANRPRAGTRWMLRGQYKLEAIKPGVFDGMEIEPPSDGRPPKRPDLLPLPAGIAPTMDNVAKASLSIGRWKAAFWRETKGEPAKRS